MRHRTSNPSTSSANSVSSAITADGSIAVSVDHLHTPSRIRSCSSNGTGTSCSASFAMTFTSSPGIIASPCSTAARIARSTARCPALPRCMAGVLASPLNSW
jgi:hypothetical protein